MKDQPTQKIKIPVGRCTPKSPMGVLGGYIQRKLNEYIEPSREGTPKGQAVGFTKQKYHALLLANLTSLDLKRIAKEVGTSHGVVRNWNSEKDFEKAGEAIRNEFIKGPFDDAARLSAIIEREPTFPIESSAVDQLKQMKENKLVGFDDAGFYSALLLFTIEVLFEDTRMAFMEQLLDHVKRGADPDYELLSKAGEFFSWLYVLDRIDQMRTVPARRHAKALRDFRSAVHKNVRWISLIIEIALRPKSLHPQYRAIAANAAHVLRLISRG